MEKRVVESEVPVIVRSYVKRVGLPRLAAPACSQRTAPRSTTPLTAWSSGTVQSFGNDHMIEWPMGTGGNPPG